MWQIKNRKKHSKIMAFQNAKRRSRKRANGGRGFVAKHWRELQRRAGGLCAYCREHPANSVDHFIPLVKGGPHDYANIVPACKHCNSWKRQHDPEQWVTEKFGAERLAFVRSIMLV